MTKKINIFSLHLGIKIACLLPRPFIIAIAKLLAIARFFQAQKEKSIVRKNLSYCGIKVNSRNIFENFLNYSICLSDAFRVPIYDNESLNKIVEFNSADNLTQALGLNRGVILISAHLGNWDLAGVYLASLGFPLTAVAEEIPGLSDIYNFIRTRTGMEIVFMHEKDKLVSALNNNRVLVLLGDRDLTRNGLKVKFLLGKKTVPRGLATFALRYKTPVCFGYFVLNNDKKSKKIYKAEISESTIVPENISQEAFLQSVADILSNYIRQYPTQWFVFRDEWENENFIVSAINQ